MKHILYILSLSLLLTAVSCEVNLDVPIPEHTPRLTLNTFLSPDNFLQLYISRSFGIADDVNDSSILVTDAEVSIFRDGEFLDVMVFRDTVINDTFMTTIQTSDTSIIFQSIQSWPGSTYFTKEPQRNPLPGETYTFVVTHPTLGEAEATTTIPEAIEIQDVDLVVDSIQNRDLEGFEASWNAMNIRFNDPGDQENFYKFYYFAQYEQERFSSGGVDTLGQGSQLGIDLQQTADGFQFADLSPLSDTEFNGASPAQATTWFQLFTNSFDINGNPVPPNIIEVEIELFSMDKEYAIFSEKKLLQDASYTTGIESAFFPAEPVILNSNVKGGYGLVGSFNRTIYKFVP
ncbi:MAG: DUF4249 domain-containing protein [Bacteroidota bacterium]